MTLFDKSCTKKHSSYVVHQSTQSGERYFAIPYKFIKHSFIGIKKTLNPSSYCLVNFNCVFSFEISKTSFFEGLKIRVGDGQVPD